MTWPPPTHDSLRARALRLTFRGTGYCGRCGLPWACVTSHTTYYGDPLGEGGMRGCFPLCEDCWQTLGHPEARIPYYRVLIEHWQSQSEVHPDVIRAIGRAVANEPVLTPPGPHH